MKQENVFKYFIVLLFASIILCAGCEKKTQNTEQPVGDTVKTTIPKTDTTAAADTTKVMSLLGTWNGILNERVSTFRVTEFKDNKIKGAISVQSRGVITHEVAGTFVPETRAVRLSDVTRSRDMGRYSGTLSEDGKTLSGTFTQNADGRTSKFNYKKAK